MYKAVTHVTPRKGKIYLKSRDYVTIFDSVIMSCHTIGRKPSTLYRLPSTVYRLLLQAMCLIP